MNYKILLIDDSLFSLNYHSELVKAAGHLPITAINGTDALELYQKSKPDFILCDIMMPEMDGYEVFSELKNIDPRVILYFVTAEVSNQSLNKAKMMNAAGIFQKPIDLSIINNILKEFENFKF